MFKYYKKVVFDNYANFNGRARRSEFWYFLLVNLIFSVTAMIVDKAVGLKIGVQSVYIILLFLPALAVSVRRLHDVGKSGWWLLAFYVVLTISIVSLTISKIMSQVDSISGYLFLGVPLLLMISGGIWMLVLHCKAGDTGVNKYGSDPKLHGEEINEIGTA